MKKRYPIRKIFVTMLMCLLLGLMLGGLQQSVLGETEIKNLTLTLQAGDYVISDAEDGYDIIEMEGFGALGVPGKPQLPARKFMIAIPPGARVQRVNISMDRPVPVEGTYRIAPVKPSIPGVPAQDQITVNDAKTAQQEYLANYDAMYSQNIPYPEEVGSFLGQGQWRKYTYASVEFHPFQYQPYSGQLMLYPSLIVSIDYTLPEPESAEWQQVQRSLSDDVMEDIISEWLVNYEEAQSWYQPRGSEALAPADSDNGEKYDYVIITNKDFANAVAPLETWKEQIGFNVNIVTTDYIYDTYPGDKAAQIWNFLNDRYLDWQIRYVLLVGDIDEIPMRILYPDGRPGDGYGYGTDYYYAKLSTTDWDVDNDNRWGEFTQDNFDETPDVLVGRIPVNDTNVISTICTNIVNFEQDISAWKRQALMGHGFMDCSTDMAVLAELLQKDFFDPLGWNYTTLYEKGGNNPSSYACDFDLDQTNFAGQYAPQGQGIINAAAHGGPGGMQSKQWSDKDRNGACICTKEYCELVGNNFCGINGITANSAVVFLNGCSTGPLWPYDEEFVKNPLRSLFLNTITQNSITKKHLHQGSVAVIASSTGSEYEHNWSRPEDGDSQSLNYYFYDHLINKDKKVGDAFYDAQLQYVNEHQLQRAIRCFNFFGDPSLVLKGIDYKPGGTDSLIHEANYISYAADNSDSGDMYVAVLTTPNWEPGEIVVYKSTDHGEHWGAWTGISSSEGIWDVDILVGEWQKGAVSDNALHVIYSTSEGELYDARVDLANPGNQDLQLIHQEGIYLKNISVARDPKPMPSDFNIYVAWEMERPLGTYYVKVASSSDNGQSWSIRSTNASYLMPHIDAGPNGHVYVTALTDPLYDVYVWRSVDYGVTWGDRTDLTWGDNALMHTSPMVAASTDPTFPAVWVAYDYQYQSELWGSSFDLRFAYSTDGGANWNKHRILSADQGVREWLSDMVGYRANANRWVNIAYNSDLRPTDGYRRNVTWRYTSGGLPVYWTAQRIVNDFDAAAPYADPPCVVYSPGIGPGGGVVYGGAERFNIYFSAAWLIDMASEAEQSDQMGSLNLGLQASLQKDTAATGPDISGADQEMDSTVPLIWLETADLEAAFSASSLFQTEDGTLYAGTSLNIESANQGAVFRSTNGGATWARLADLPLCWSVSCVFQSREGYLFAGGMMVEGEQTYAMIYRSPNGGMTWDMVMAIPDGVVCDLMQAADGRLYAATGWNGLLFISEDGGEWAPIANFGEGVNIYSIMQASNGLFFLGLEGPEGARIMRSENGEDWTPAEGLEGVHAVYDIIQGGDRLYAGVKIEETGLVFQSDLEGLYWHPTAELPGSDIRAIRSLLEGPMGQIFAGADMKPGASSTSVFVTWNQGETWQLVGGAIDLANAVYDMVNTPDMIYAATGCIYGNVYKCGIYGLIECGDVNCDRTVNMADVMILWYDIADYPSAGAWTIFNGQAADVNCDEEINMADVMILWYDIADYPSAGTWEVNCCE